jgi:hypothetical protein
MTNYEHAYSTGNYIRSNKYSGVTKRLADASKPCIRTVYWSKSCAVAGHPAAYNIFIFPDEPCVYIEAT